MVCSRICKKQMTRGKVEGEFVNLLKDLTSSDENIMASLNRYIDMIEG